MRVNLDLQDDFRLNQPLSLFVVEAIEALDPDAPDHHLQVLSLVESVLDDPMVILFAQLDKAKDQLVSRLKAEGVEYEQRMDELDKLTWPKPEADFIEPAFEIFSRQHPWVGRDTVGPKSVAREMFEHAENFNQYVTRHGLKRSEGLLLRYLTDCYKTLVQTVPAEHGSDDLDDVVEWLGAVVRRVDSSLLDEWERLRNPDPDLDDAMAAPVAPDDITANPRAFTVMVRNQVFGLVSDLALGRGEPIEGAEAYWDEHASIAIDADARATRWVDVDLDTGRVVQTLRDPEGHDEWVLDARVDLDASRSADRPVVVPVAVRRR